MTPLTIVIIVTVWLLCALLTIAIARFRKLSIKSWVFLGVLLGPVAVAYALSPDNAPSHDWRGRGSGGNSGSGGAGSCGGGSACSGGGCGGGGGS